MKAINSKSIQPLHQMTLRMAKYFLQPEALFFLVVLFIILSGFNSFQLTKSNSDADQYQCTPCGYDCDNKLHNSAGTCDQCNMQLVKKSTIHFKTIEPAKLCQYISTHPNLVLLDVRTKEEFEGKADPDFGTLKNAINLPIQELEAKIATLNSYKNKEIIVFCSHSHRSPQASYILMQHGFKNVTNMAGGMSVLQDNSCKK